MAGESIDAFLWFDDGRVGPSKWERKVAGETTDHDHRKHAAMQIRNYTFDFTMQTEGSEEKQGDKGKQELPDPTFAPVKITKSVDTASPVLLEALCYGVRFDKVHISQRKAGHDLGSSGGDFWKIDLGGVTIDDLNWTVDESGGITESLSLRYESIDVCYQQQSRSGRVDEKTPVTGAAKLKGAEGLKDKNKGQGSGGIGSDASQVAGLVDKVKKEVMKELERSGLIGHGAGSGGARGHGR